MKIGYIEYEIFTFYVPGRKMYLLLPESSSGQKEKTRFLPGTSHFLHAGDIGGDINTFLTYTSALRKDRR